MVLSVLKYSNYPPSCKKSEKTNDLFLREMPTDGQPPRQPDRQTNGDFIGLSIGRVSKKSTMTKI